jgi:cytochrome c
MKDMHEQTPAQNEIQSPVSWLMERDIVKARKAMNLSSWSSYSESQKQAFAAQIVRVTRTHEMPMMQYRIIHWNSRITDSDVRASTAWANAMQLSGRADDGQLLQPSNADRGKQLVDKRCAACHSLESNKEGPSLRNVFGRTAGTASGYDYSSTLKNARVGWNEDSLEKWLADPDAFLPGNNMDFHVAKEQERRDLIQFLKQIAGQ